MSGMLLSIALTLGGCSGDDPPSDDTDDTDDTPVQTGDTGTLATGDTGTPTTAAFDAWVASMTQQAQAAGAAGFQVAVAIDGEVQHTASWGVRDARTGEPITDQTRFSFAGLSTTFAAAAAYDLQEDGLLDLDAPVTDVAPSLVLAPGFAPSTLSPRMGLNHTSGLPDWLELGTTYASYDEMWTDGQLPLLTPPGEITNYSNLGYALAAHAISEAAGKPFAEVVDERIAQPLGLSVTYDIDEVLAGDYAHGHGQSDPSWVDQVAPGNWGGWVSEASNGLWGTATDVAVLLAALDGQTGPLDAASYADMKSGQGSYLCGDVSYGAGLWTFEDPVSGLSLVENNGVLAGFATYAVVVPELDMVIVVLMNDWVMLPDFLGWEGLWTFQDIDADPVWPLPSTPPDLALLEGSVFVHVDGNLAPFVGEQWWAPGILEWATTDIQVQGTELSIAVDGVPVDPLPEHFLNNCWSVEVPGWGNETVEFWPDNTGGFDWIVSRTLGSAVRDAGAQSAQGASWTPPRQGPQRTTPPSGVPTRR